MKKIITIFGILMIFLVGIVSANPVLTGITGNSGNENSTLTIIVSASAPDNCSSAYLANNSKLVPNIFDNASATFKWDAGFDDAGVYDILFTVSDCNSTDSKTYTVTVNNVNREPTASSPSANTTTPVVNTTVQLNGAGTDPDGDNLTYQWGLISKPSGSSETFSTTTQNPTFTPAYIGTYVFNLTVADPSGLSASNTVSITSKVKTNLELYDLDVKVGSKSDTNIENKGIDNPYEITRDAAPGDKIIFDAEVKNIGDIDMDDVIMRVTIYGWDEDGDDVDDETDGVSINDGSKKSLKLEFDTPTKTEEASYDVLIEIEGTDDDGESHYLKRDYQISVNLESHEILITQSDIGSSTVSCNRRTNLDITVTNQGSNDEEEIKITAKNTDLGLDFTEWDNGDIELISGRDDSDYSVSIPVDATKVTEGDYPIVVNVYRDETRLMDTKTVTLTVEKCSTAKPVTPVTPDEDTTGNDVDVIVKPGTGTTTTPSGTTFPVIAIEDNGSFTESAGYIALLVIGALVLVALIIWIIVLLIKK